MSRICSLTAQQLCQRALMSRVVQHLKRCVEEGESVANFDDICWLLMMLSSSVCTFCGL
jgi:hypothetical protein